MCFGVSVSLSFPKAGNAAGLSFFPNQTLSCCKLTLYYCVRRPSCYSCIRVNTLKSTSDAIIKKLLVVLQERGWKSYPTGGASVPQNSDDIAMAQMDSAGIPDASEKDSLISKCNIPNLDYVIFVKGSGPHTIDYGYKEGKPPKEVIVSRKCAEAVLRGAHVSTN